MGQQPLVIIPNKGLGFLLLGASVHDVLIRLKAQPQLYPIIDISYSPPSPLVEPIILTLPQNGLRLRFDGPDQRLRLIEVLDFTKVPLSYRNLDVVKLPDQQDSSISNKPTGPGFRYAYQRIFGPTFPGEYIPPAPGSTYGTYVLSYPGLALSFPLHPSAWSPGCDFVKTLEGQNIQSLAIFNGSSWKDARQDLYTQECTQPRSLAANGKGRHDNPEEIECIKICGNGRLELQRGSTPPFQITLSQTTPQELVAELGPPDAIYRKNDRRLSIHKTRAGSQANRRPVVSNSPARHDGYSDTDRSSVITSADDSDSEESPRGPNGTGSEFSSDCFYNYFSHGFDVFISYPAGPSVPLRPLDSGAEDQMKEVNAGHLVATKILLHGNVPGSYPFNRYRRCRWVLDPEQIVNEQGLSLSSETSFTQLSETLRDVWNSTYKTKEEERSVQRGMVLNRGWGDSPGSSCELLGGWEESADLPKRGRGGGTVDNEPGLGNTELFGFPGLLFEVLKNDCISCVTVY
ncbi:MAG: hypothetical protein MMC33_007010 [Icmadophila ericetorum]|nr:hypothetical protein [Icmadophila ericetorum]